MNFKAVTGRPFRQEVAEVNAGIHDSDGIHHTIRTGLNNIVDDIRNGQEPDLQGVLYSCNNFETGRRRIINGARGIYNAARVFYVATLSLGLTTAIAGAFLTASLLAPSIKTQAAETANSVKSEPDKKPYVRDYPCDKVYHIDAIVDGKAYEQNDVPSEKETEKYQIVVRKILSNGEDFRADIEKNVLEDYLNLLNTSELYDRENKTFESRRGYKPIEIARFSQALSENNKITKESLKKKQDKTGYKQIVGE